MEEVELKLKMKHAIEWCKKVSELSKFKWFYFKILKNDFEKYKNQRFSTLAKFLLPKETLETKKTPIEIKPKEKARSLGLFEIIKNWILNLFRKIFK